MLPRWSQYFLFSLLSIVSADTVQIIPTTTQYLNTAPEIVISCNDCPGKNDQFNLPRPFYNKETGEYDAQCTKIVNVNPANFTCIVGGIW